MMSTIDPFAVLFSIADLCEDSEDKEWLQARLQFIILSLTTTTEKEVYYDDDDSNDDD